MYASSQHQQRGQRGQGGQGGQGKYVHRNNNGVDMHRKNSSPNQGVSIFIPNVWHSFKEQAIKNFKNALVETIKDYIVLIVFYKD